MRITLWGEREKGRAVLLGHVYAKNPQDACEHAGSQALFPEILIQFGAIYFCNKSPFQFFKSCYRSSQLSFEMLMKETHNPITLFFDTCHVFPVILHVWGGRVRRGKMSNFSSASLIGTFNSLQSFYLRCTVWFYL